MRRFALLPALALIAAPSYAEPVKTEPAQTPQTKALIAEIRALKDRIQVLERIATDNNRAVTLDQEIEKLRDNSKI